MGSGMDQILLSFEENPAKVRSCEGTSIRLSNQGWGVKEEEWEAIHADRRRRTKRQWVTAEQLAAQLALLSYIPIARCGGCTKRCANNLDEWMMPL